MKIAIVKYNAGNVCSVDFALQRMGVIASITANAEEILSADKVIFPGVGSANAAMQYLADKRLDKVIKQLQQPVLGICLGMQLLCDYSEEGDTPCLGIFKQRVRKFSSAVKVPQVGWNTISALNTPLFKNINEEAYMYFVHSYYVEKNEYTIAETEYDTIYSAAMQKDNFYAVQFHPEKSGEIGQKVLENFIQL